MQTDWMRLKSGSDIRGIAVGEPGSPATLTEDVGSAVGVAFGRWLQKRLQKPGQSITLAVGRDSRVSGEALKAALIRGLNAEAIQVLDCGLCTTPAMFMSTILLHCDAAVMVTASHLPWQRNGYKFFTAEGGLGGQEIADILQAAAQLPPVKGKATAKQVDYLYDYIDFLKDKVRDALGDNLPLAGLHIVVDAGNGAGGFYAELLSTLGAITHGSQYLEPDGRFPNHIPNPEAPEAMRALSDAVTKAHADLGVLFDADCDRAALVDVRGNEINRNRLIALMAAIMLKENPGCTIVTDSVTSAGLDAFITERGGTLHRFKRGYRNVIDEAIRLNAEGIDCPLAMETSGHAALRENRFLDDGMYLVTRLVIEAQRLWRDGKPLGALIDTLQEPLEAVEIRLPIRAEDFRAVGERVIERVMEAVRAHPDQTIDPLNREGVRIQFGTPENWLLLRLSVHDPLIVINTEAASDDGVDGMLDALEAILTAFPEIDLAALEAAREA